MKTSRRSLFGMLAVAPVAIAETAKAFKEAPEPSKLKEEDAPFTRVPRYCGYSDYGGGFIVRGS